MFINEDFLDDLPKIDKTRVASPAKFWALYAETFYEKDFANIYDIERLKESYYRRKKHIQDQEALAALTFFYRIRRDEIHGDFVWESKIFESPDMIEARNLDEIRPGARTLDLSNLQVPFGYYKNEIKVGKIGGIHPSIKDFYSDMENTESSRHDLSYSGRIWIKDKIISFWDYPETHKALYDILSDIENEFYHKFHKALVINPNDWYIEVVDKHLKGDNFPEYFKEWKDAEDALLIPVRDYKGSEKWSKGKKGQEHAKSPLVKQNHPGMSYGGGSKLTGWDSNRNLKRRQSERTSENLYPSFSEFIKLDS